MKSFERFSWRGCWRCQHCLAVCPVGAISIFDKKPENSLPLPPDEMRTYMEQLITSRRSCRRFLDKNVELELKDLFEELGFERKDLKTLYFNVDTEYESYQDSDKNWKRRFEGYKFGHRMKIEFPTDNALLGKVLYALAHCPAKPELSIEYTV
jgi:hypothetical protein